MGSDRREPITTEWIPPAGAVTPANAFHTPYMRSAALAEGLLVEMADDALREDLDFAELSARSGSSRTCRRQ